MKRIIRGLFHERIKQEEGKTADFFNEDSISKILRLMNQYSFKENVVLKGNVDTVENFLNRLSYQLPDDSLNAVYNLNQLKSYLINSILNEFLSTIELFLLTIKDECDYYYYNHYDALNSFISEFNNLLAIRTIPFRIEVSNKSKIFIDRINSPQEEENKNKMKVLLNENEFKEADEHFTNSLINFAKRNYPESIEEAYLTLEKYLKIKSNNHGLDANKSYVELKKLFNLKRGIFKLHEQKIKERIEFIYTIRSELKSHSDKNLYDRKDFLEETTRFQINEVMNIVILLNSFKRK